MANEARLNLVITAQDQAKTVIEEMVNNIKSAFDGLGSLTVGANFATAYEEQFREMVTATQESTSEMRNIFDLLDSGLSQIVTTVERTNQAVTTGFEEMSNQVRSSSEQMLQSLDQIGQSSEHLNEALDFQNLQMAGQMIQQVGEQITGFFEHAVGSAADFDQNIVNTTASLDANMGSVKLNTQQIKGMQDAAIKMGESGFFSANQVADAMNTMAKSGLSYQQIMSGGIDTVYKVAAANQQDIEQTATVVSDIYNEMGGIFKNSGMTAQQAADQIGNSMTVAMHHARISMDDFMSSMKYVGPQASAMGVGIKDVSALVALLGEHGIKGAQAGTTLRRMMTNLTPASKAAAEEMKKLGMITKDGSNIFYDAQGKMKPMAEVQQLLHDKLANLSPEMQQLAIKTIFGQYALSGMTAIVDTAPGKFGELTKAMNNNNTMNDIMKEKSTGLGMEIQKLNAHWQTVQKTIGEALKPMVEYLISGLNKLMKSWEGLSPGVKQAIVVFGAITGVVLLVGGGLMALIGTVGMFANAFSSGIKVFSLFTSPMALTVAAIIAAVALIGFAAYELYKHWDQVKAWLIGIWNAIAKTATSVWNGIKNFFSGVWDGVSQAMSKAWNGVKNFLSQTWNNIKNTASNVWNDLVNSIKNLWNGIVNWITGAAQNFANAIVNAFNWMYNHNYYFKDLVDFIKNAWTTIQKDAQAVWNTITSWLSSLWNGIKNTASSIWKGLVDVLSKAWDAIKSAAQTFWNNEKTNFENEWNAIVNVAKTVWNGLTSFFSSLWNTISSGVSSAWNGIKNTIGNLVNGAINAIKGPFNSLGSFFSGLWGQAEQWGANLVNMMAQGIKNAAGAVGNAVKSVASSIAGFLGFHSPTKEGPGADSDKWMPNMINMFTEGIQQHAPKLQMAISNVALGLKTGTTQMGNTINQNHISIPSNRTATSNGSPSINIYIDGRSAKTDNDLAEIIAHKIYRQMPVVS